MPWSEGFKRTNQAHMERQGVEYSLESGYRYKRILPARAKAKKPKMREVKLHDGRKVMVPVEIFEDYIAYTAPATIDPDTAVADYIDKAWDSKRVSVKGVGHIKEIDYIPSYQMMFVTFITDGSVVIYFRVPAALYAELEKLAKDKNKTVRTHDGKERHQLGVRFWDMVRIRRTRTGTRYMYAYDYKGTYEGQEAAQYKETVHSFGEDAEEWLDGFKGRLPKDKKRVYEGLDDVDEKLRYLRRNLPKGTLPTLRELKEEELPV